MISAGIGLGTGIVMYVPSSPDQVIPLESMVQSIADFGISRDELRRLEPTCRELFEIYSAIKTYRAGVTYLRERKTRSGLGFWHKLPFA